nr:hypothetical protein [Tanacetum cinerariifolium]
MGTWPTTACDHSGRKGNFIYAENEENLSFLPKEPSHGLGNGSLSISVNTDPLSVDSKPSQKLAEHTDFLDNVVNSKSRELLQVIKKIRGECDVMKQRKRAQVEDFEELRSKCEDTMIDFEKNPTVVAMRQKMSTLYTEAKEHKANIDRMLLEIQNSVGYHVSLSALESKVASLEADKARLEVVEASLKKEVDDVKCDRMEVADMKDPFDLLKVKGYRPSYKKEHTQAGNKLATATFPWLTEFVADPSATIEVLLSKKPPALQRHVPLKTQVIVPSSQRATPSFTLASNLMCPPAAVLSVQPHSSQGFDGD